MCSLYYTATLCFTCPKPTHTYTLHFFHLVFDPLTSLFLSDSTLIFPRSLLFDMLQTTAYKNILGKCLTEFQKYFNPWITEQKPTYFTVLGTCCTHSF